MLSVLRARDLEHALRLANGTRYGLVAGLHSLDEREQQRFLAGAAAGNLYVNRSITGAVVGRQPFGGRKASSVGPGAKAGGPNYVAQLQRLRDSASPFGGDSATAPATATASDPALRRLVETSRAFVAAPVLARLDRGIAAYERALDDSFRGGVDRFQLPGQDNTFRYQACRRVLIVANRGSDPGDLLLSCAAGLLAGVELQVSQPEAGGALLREALLAIGDAAGFPVVIESEAALEGRLAELAPERIRWLGDAADDRLLWAAVALGVHVGSRPVVSHGRHELLFFHREQALSVDYHRHGHLGLRSSGIDLARTDIDSVPRGSGAAASAITSPA
jgi:RHH-type proline utilization regulon transcriptional repressor/proline dehydrogenase/delta 1-pyrroline-5-carboxylate dehydrogenase